LRFSVWLWPYGRWGGVETLGFDSITVSDHTVAPAGGEGRALGSAWPDWSVLSTQLALATTRLRVVACVVVPYRHPVVTAKQIATIDAVSRGRFTLAACVGWWRREFDMLGVPYEQRGDITDDYLEAMRALWTDERPRFSSPHVSFDGIVFEPKGVQRPHVPIWIAGGAGRRSLQRVLRYGDGWMPMGDDRPAALASVIASIKSGAAGLGRDPAGLTFRYTIGLGDSEPALGALSEAIARADGGVLGADPSAPVRLPREPEAAVEAIARYAAAGFTELAINPAGRDRAECMDRLAWFAEAVMPTCVRVV
jgi:probable F420-dependent oxidoreductase